jgi:hypothetical protein
MHPDDKPFYRAIAILLGIVAVFYLFLSLVVGPAHNQQRDACEAKGGVLVGKYGDCIKKEYVL